MSCEDLSQYAVPSTNCGPSWTYINTNGCVLWQQTYNTYYLSNIDNGEGWNESIVWSEAHNNTYGVDSGAATNALTCNGNRTATNNCGLADEHSWSRYVVYSRTAVTNGVSSTWSYKYYLNTLTATLCTNSSCTQGYTWGNINNNDYADYYNGEFTSFATVQVTQPDASYQQYSFASTPGWGLASSGITCYYKYEGTSHCGVASYWGPDTADSPALAGQQLQELSYSSSGQLMTASTWNYATNCPPPGVAHSASAAGPPYDVGNQYLSSEMDENNPVVVCDPRVTQEDDYQVDGATASTFTSNANVVHRTTTTTYDGDDQGSSHTSGYDYGNISSVNVTGNDVNGNHYISDTTYYPNDTSTVYLTDLPAATTTEDSSGTQYGCHVNFYGGSSSYTTAPSLPDVTRTEDHTGYSDPTNGCLAPGSLLVNQTTYDASGNPTATIDGDTHLGCTSGSTTDSACAVYDGSATHVVSETNAKNQTSTDIYNTTSAGGYGQWLMATKDVNGQSTAYQYDVLGRLTAVADPGDTLTSPTVSYTYKNTCTAGSTSPCLEMDTTTRQTIGGSQTLTMQQWYDGQGRLVETKTPGPNLLSTVPKIPSTLVTYTIYDNMGQATTTSQAYAISALTGTGYIAPDLTQPRTVTSYDSLGRSLGSVTYSNATTIALESSTAYTVAVGLPSFTQSTTLPFERTTTLDA